LAKRPDLSGRRMANNGQHAARWMPMVEEAEKQPYVGITTDGKPVLGLYPVRPTGHSTRPITDAANEFLATLSNSQRSSVQFDIDSREWQRWLNISPYVFRHGLLLEDLTEAQRDAALAMIEATLSEAGFESMRNCMRLNHTIGEITNNMEEYGEWVYFLSIFGTPYYDRPWGWQLDGHHVNLHCFVLGDQLVFTPAFLGSEPVVATTGVYNGVGVMQDEERAGLAMMKNLDKRQRVAATVSDELHGAFTGAFRDNFELKYEGVRAGSLSTGQQKQLLDLIGVYVGRIRDGHSAVKLGEVRAHMTDTYFAWMGPEPSDQSVFYYRVHSPVILIEFDHQGGVAFDNKVPSRNHIHTIVRTPNGNDYGKDLLRQHHEAHTHA
ncbi:MAG TPA: DUF3500 domain-containing protein, partial [Dehalococcoidia bacterium]|nr:DUF3500 domain-containing protein [Dehalococcoidia bacterium]